MTVPARNRESERTFRPSGPLSVGSLETLKSGLAEALAEGRPIRFDLAAVNQIDLAGLQLLTSAQRSFDARAVGFTVVGSSEGILAAALAEAGFEPLEGVAK